jgi:predicted CXXCH cytochrome family protein
VKNKSKGPARRIRLRAVVAYPAVSVALVAAVALALTPFGPSQVMALAAAATPTETAAPTATTTTTPSTTTTTTPSTTTTTTPSTTTTTVPLPAPIPSPSSVASLAPGDVPVDHHVLARIDDAQHQVNYLPLDAPVPDASQFQTFRVRFKMHNAGTAPMTATPRLEFRPDGGTAYVVVPKKPQLGVPFHVTREWVPSLGLGGGTKQGPLGEDIALANLKTGSEGGGIAVIGHRSMGANPDRPITLQGVAVVDPKTTSSAGVAYPLLSATSTVAKTTSGAAVAAVPAVYRPKTVGYPLTASTLSAATSVPSDIHGPYSVTADQCAVCHRAHAAKSPELLVNASQSALCFTCHDNTGQGATTDVQTHYALVRPANDPVAREYYSHDAVSSTPSTTRPSECADCHDSHKARPTPDSSQAQDGTGWQASGRLAGVSGVSVVNGPAGSAPTYTPLDGDTNKITLEYQLCFKCHSGSATLLPPVNLKPSKDSLDKGVEFNPANASFHPVEAAGKNQSPAMTSSLTTSSPYKLWNFTIGSTIRCLNCHASSSTPNATTPPADAAAAGSSLPPHTSTNRGILLRNYKDRVLKSTGEAYSAGDFALCYVCHGEAPFAPGGSSSTATNFRLHSFHIASLSGGSGTGTDIDTPGAGGGKAICAECHFRIHSTTNKVGTQSISGGRLVNFAPNVQPNGSVLSWTQPGTTSGSCTLTCHGEPHDDYGYNG